MKTAYFYALEIREKGNDILQPLSLFKNIIENIIQSQNSQNEYCTIDISSPDDGMKTVIDIFDYKDEHLFCRLSKQRPTNTVVGRNYDTLKTEPVMGNYPDNKKGIENYSFAYINYQTLIAEIVTSQYSPTETAIENFIKMNSNYYVESRAIPNRVGIDSIFRHRKPVISSFTVDIPTPSPALLESFGFNDAEITNTIGNNIRAKITIAPLHGRTLVANDDAHTLVQKVRDSALITEAIFKAKSESIKAREYNLYDESFKYDINIPTSHTVNGNVISYNESNLIEMARNKLIENYYEKYDIIVSLANRSNEG